MWSQTRVGLADSAKICESSQFLERILVMETGEMVVAEAIDASGWVTWSIYSVSLFFMCLWILGTVVSEFC